MNRNLHTTDSLTEFARDFEDEEQSTIFTKFVNRLTNAYNTNYNSFNSVNSIDAAVQEGPSAVTIDSNVSTVLKESSPSAESETSSINEYLEKQDELPMDESTVGRTPVKVLSRISKILALKNNNLNDYKNTELQKFWMPDAKSKECYECSQKFTTFRRKHHCRLCGQIFCSKCCNQVVPGKIMNCTGELKVCNYCSKVVLTYLKSPDLTDLTCDLQALQEDLTNKISSTQASAPTSDTGPARPMAHRKVSVGYQEERLVSNPNAGLSNADRRSILQQSNSLKQLYEDMSRELLQQNRGEDLVVFLISNNKSSNKTQAVAILNALIEAGFLILVEPVPVSADTFGLSEGLSDEQRVMEFDETSVYKLLRSNDMMTHSGSYQLDVDFEANSVHLMKPLLISSNPDDLAADAGDGRMGSQSAKQLELESSIFSTAGAKPLLEAFCDHEEALLAQLLQHENLDSSWSKTLIPICARVANTVRPELCSDYCMDVRNFVNFKKVPGGSRNDSIIVGGVVFTKNVAHKGMSNHFEKPKVLLVQCAIVYQRDESKFVSIESVLLQEKEYLRNVTSRILSLNPNVVLVHKNVAGIAQDMLRNSGITLVLDVKLAVMERLARCMQCDVLTSINSNIGRPKLGNCERFYIKNFDDNHGVSKTLMCFDIPYCSIGQCVLLRGGSNAELTKVKKVASLLLFARYNWRLEMSYLLDELARPPSPKPLMFDSKEQSPSDELETPTIVENKATDEDTKLELVAKQPATTTKEKSTINIENVQDFSDPLRAAFDLSPSVFSKDNESNVELAVEMPYDNCFRTALNSTILSISPFITFPLPYLETEQGRKCLLRKRFPNELFFSKQWSTLSTSEKPERHAVAEENEQIELFPQHEFLRHKIKTPVDSKEFQALIANFRASGGRYPKKETMNKNNNRKKQPLQSHKSIEEYVYKDALELENHQRLPVLFCSFYYNPKAPSTFCTQPSSLDMQFYGQNDIMLGLFLKRYCFRSSYICQSCKLPMLDHIRRYVHSLGCVQVKLAEDPKAVEQTETISMTSWCSKCHQETPSVPMSKDTWCLSFAKFLELKFHAHFYKRRAADENASTSACEHSMHKDYVQFFSHNGITASFMYTSIEVWEICLPALIVELKPSKASENGKTLEEVKQFAQKGYEVFVKIHDRLAELTTETEFPMLKSLKLQLNEDQLGFKKRVAAVQTCLTEEKIVSLDVKDAMYMMKRKLAECIEAWSTRLHDAAIQSKTHQQKLEQQMSVDNGQICTEDLKTDTEEKPTTIVVENEQLPESTVDQTAKLSEITDGAMMSKVEEVSPQAVISEKDYERPPSTDKKLKNLLSQFLPSMGNSHALPSPLPNNHHFLLPLGVMPILVIENDVSSIVAYSLMSNDYMKALEALYVDQETNASPNFKTKSQDLLPDSEDKEIFNRSDNEKRHKSMSHIEIHAQDSTCQLTCKIYFAREFDQLRKNFVELPKLNNTSTADGSSPHTRRWASVPSADKVESHEQKDKKLDKQVSDGNFDTDKKPPPVTSKHIDDVRKAFASSLATSTKWEARGGKSGSNFSKTEDDRFVLKEMSNKYVATFEDFAPNYFEYLNHCLTANQPTLLAKILGVYRVIIKKKDSTVYEKSVLVMENLFSDKEISNKFDLKGSERNRLVDPNGQTGEIVLLDENLIQMSWSKPLYILTHSRTILREAISRDSTFLEKNSVIDYSLLVGLDNKENVLVLGIIDYICTYTFDKKLESLIKTVGSQGKLPTVVSPKVYKSRFIDAMERYFLIVPDRWEGLSKK